MSSRQPFFAPEFQRCLSKYHHLKDRVKNIIERILEDPYSRSHLIKKKDNVDLRGKRSRHLSRNFVFIYIICEECRKEEFRGKGYNNCKNCGKIPKDAVIFLAFGKHDDIYAREWAEA